MRHFILTSFIVLLAGISFEVRAQESRPIPYPVFTTAEFDEAVQNGTRTLSGKPGARYWTNYARYSIDAVLSPEKARLSASSSVTYFNNSPDTLDAVLVHLRQNLNAEGSVRNRPQTLTGGVKVGVVSVNGTHIVEQSPRSGHGYSINGTVMRVSLSDSVVPGDSVQLGFQWSFVVPEVGAPRMGQDGEVFYLGYWYPQIAVYDDLEGWRADQYFGNGEFYMGYADYNVRITVPEDYLVAATGTLQNDADVLTAETRDRLKRASRSDTVIQIVSPEDRGSATIDSRTGVHTWEFEAAQVRDFAFGASAKYVWDSVRANAGDISGNGRDQYTRIHALYRPEKSAWNRAAEFGQFTIEDLSSDIFPYPYPHMTIVEGIIGGGMEYPMITLIGGDRNDRRLFGTTYHEIGHMWFPMIVGQNEKQYTWMDEGLTSFNTSDGAAEFWNEDSWNPDRQSYYRIAGTTAETESMRHGDQYPYGTPSRGIASYNKPAVWMHALRGVLGEERFNTAYREYATRWQYKHPQPYDLFNTFEDVAGRDLDWFWRVAFFETWTLDQAIASVDVEDNRVTVTVRDLGLVPMPVPVRVTYGDGRIVDRRLPVSVWLDGQREAKVEFPAGNPMTAEIDPDLFLPDVARENNRWEHGE
ncbi:MAG: M1 family metallopeptidase [Rhodothermales bacterium]|nr:M1 family metallopeptidase [Rhodothermales bacterium]